MAEKNLRCPVCNQLGKKLSAITESETRTVFGTSQSYNDGSWTSTPYSGTEMTKRAEMLAPPPRPQYPGTTMVWVVSFIGMLCMMTGIYPAAIVSNAFLKERIVLRETILYLAFIMPFFIVGAGIIGAALINYNRQRRKVEAQMPAWVQAWKRWNELYYCENDHIIYVPETRKYMQLTQMRQHLYD